MCGIAGAITASPHPRVVDTVKRLTAALAHRGPDGEFFWSASCGLEAGRPDAGGAGRVRRDSLPAAATVAFGHRRLAIVDLATGDQPLCNEDGSVWVCYNGEIYNAPELRRELEAEGHRFATQADTEVLVHGWESWREALFARLNGIFAFALYDARAEAVWLVRDPVGVKPLYYGVRDGLTWWSSELDAAHRCGLAREELNVDALKLYLTFRFVPSPATIRQDAWKLPPGHFVKLAPGSAAAAPELRRYQTRVVSAADPRGRDQWCDALMEELGRAVSRQLMSDVPVGALLSGGVDSSLITSMMTASLPAPPQTFGIGFRSHGAASETRGAALAAAELGVPHVSIEVEDAEYISAWPASFASSGEPIANSSSLLLRLLCERVGKTHKVVLTGQGADEPLGGYPRHAALRLQALGRFAPRLSARITQAVLGSDSGARLARVLRSRDRIERFAEIFTVIPAEDVDRLLPGTGAPTRELARAAIARWLPADAGADALNALLRTDRCLSLSDDLLLVADRESMASSVELRVPFLDLALLDLMERMPSRYKVSWLGERKWLYRRGAARRLPRELARRLLSPAARMGRKQGFTTPVERWFQTGSGDLDPSADWLSGLRGIGALRSGPTEAFVADRQKAGGARQLALLFALSQWAAGNAPGRDDRRGAA